MVLTLAAFAVYWYQTQTTIAGLERKGTFSQSIVLLPRTSVILQPCSQIGCDSDHWSWDFPNNMSLQYPGYLNVTVYSSNATSASIFATWHWSNGNGGGLESWDYTTGAYPRTTPAWTIIPVIQGMVGLNIHLNSQSFLTSEQAISITYYY